MGKSRLLYALAGIVIGVGVLVALFGVKSRYSCGEGWDVSQTSRTVAVALCSAGDGASPRIHTDLALGQRIGVLLVAFAVGSVPLRLASNDSTRGGEGSEDHQDDERVANE
jgi:hypothetical protein